MSPFKSKAQQRFLFAKHPKIAKEFAKKTKSFTSLPEKVGKMGTSQALKKHNDSKKRWIKGAIKHPGALRKQLKIKKGKKIPSKTLSKASKKKGKLGKRARLAKTLKKLSAKKKR